MQVRAIAPSGLNAPTTETISNFPSIRSYSGWLAPDWTEISNPLHAKNAAAMKTDEAFRDLKSLLNLHKLMNKRRALMEKMVRPGPGRDPPYGVVFPG